MFKRANNFYIRTMYINAHKKRLHWLYFTLFIGALPLLIRFIVWLSVSDVPMLPIVVGDVVFLAIMLNVAALYNITVTENVPDVQVSTIAAALIRIVILVALYTAALFPGINFIALWIVVALLLLISLIASFFATDSIGIQSQQKFYDMANTIVEYPLEVRKQVLAVIDRHLENPENVDLDAELQECFAQMTTKEWETFNRAVSKARQAVG